MNHEIQYKVNENGKEYVGIELKKNKMTVKLPIGYFCPEEKEEEEFKKEIRKIITILAKKAKIAEEVTNQKKEVNFDFITSLKLVNDYNNYGLYKQMELKTRRNDKGKINWAKTMKQNQTYIGNQMFFTNVVNEYTDYKAEKEIQTIQKFCLYQISKNLGYLLNFSYPKIAKRFEKSEMLNILKKELENTNEDIKIEMLRNLLEFVKNTNINAMANGNISIKYKEFEYIYQNLVDVLGMPHKEKSKYYPKAKYEYWEKIENRKEYKIPDPSCPDTIIRNLEFYPDVVFILDAKYKRIGNLPNEYDIFKQMRYANYVENKLKREAKKHDKIINAFIMPNNLPEEIIRIENYYARSEDLEERIFVVYLDTKSLIMEPKDTIKRLLELLVRVDEIIQLIEENKEDKNIDQKLKKYIHQINKDNIWGEKISDKLETFIKRAYPSLKNFHK